MEPSTRTLMSMVPVISLSIKSMLFLNSVPCLKKLAILTSTLRYNSPIMLTEAIKIPEPNIAFGLVDTFSPKYVISFSKILGFVMALEVISHFFNEIAAGRNVELKINACAIPTLMQIP